MTSRYQLTFLFHIIRFEQLNKEEKSYEILFQQIAGNTIR